MCAESQLAHIVFDDLPQEETFMEFRLLYSGRVLGASRTDTRAALKHQIRREFHPQLRRLWNTNESLREVIKRTGFDAVGDHSEYMNERSEYGRYEGSTGGPHYDNENNTLYRELGADVIADKWMRSGFRFWPLVTEEYCVRCALDILFLRPEEPGMLIRSGDIDARIKTIFDALRMPKNLDETGGMGPQEDENPFFCLLEDDKLISEIKVDTDNLLMLPKEREIKPNDALLVIHVKLWPTIQNQWDWAFF
jgi:hypothetical protein